MISKQETLNTILLFRKGNLDQKKLYVVLNLFFCPK